MSTDLTTANVMPSTRKLPVAFYPHVLSTEEYGYGPWFPAHVTTSDDLKDFISRLLTSNPRKRMTAFEAQKPPFIRRNCAEVERKMQQYGLSLPCNNSENELKLSDDSSSSSITPSPDCHLDESEIPRKYKDAANAQVDKNEQAVQNRKRVEPQSNSAVKVSMKRKFMSLLGFKKQEKKTEKTKSGSSSKGGWTKRDKKEKRASGSVSSNENSLAMSYTTPIGGNSLFAQVAAVSFPYC